MPTNTAVIIRSKRYKEDAQKRPEKPLPIMEDYTEEYYNWCAQDELRFQRCTSTDHRSSMRPNLHTASATIHEPRNSATMA